VTSALEGDGWSAPRPGRFIPGKDPVPIVQEAGWATGPVWTCAKNPIYTVLFDSIQITSPIFHVYHWVDPGIDGRIILRWIFRNLDVGVWTGLIWLRIGTGGGHL
jgi:hypothetical protein